MNLNRSVDSTAPTPTNVAGNFSSNAAEITYLESELAEKQKALKWADIRIIQLKVGLAKETK